MKKVKKSLFKNNFKSIHRTRRRFISILVMAFLGVGFYAGLVATSPDMLDSLDKYVDKSNLYDINIISTLGLTDDDVNKVQEIEGINNVYAVQSKDSIAKIDEKESACKVIEYNENVNIPVIIAGRNIENENECLLDKAIVRTGAGIEQYIGKKIILENDDKNSDDSDMFKVKEFEVVGIVESPMYISNERENTSIGNGSISYYIMVKDSVINMDYYTGIYATVNGAKDEVTNSEEYLNLVNPVKDRLESIKQEREEARYNSLVDEANEKIKDAQKEFDSKKAYVDRELDDAKSKIDKASKQITSSENKIKSAQKELTKQKEEASEKFTVAEKQLAEQEKQILQQENTLKQTIDQLGGVLTPQLEEMQNQINSAKSQIKNQTEILQNTKTETYSKIEKAQKEIENNKTKIQNAKNELSKSKKEYEKGKKEAEKKLQEAQEKINDAKDEVNKIEKGKWYIKDRLDNTGYTNIFDAIETMSNISKMFPVIFYLVAVLISLTSMTRMIEEERIEIGTLKALGYTNSQIITKYVMYSLLACVIGGLLGMTLGLYLLPNIVWKLYAMIYNLPKFYCTYRLNIGLIGTAIAFACIGGATILVAIKELKQMPSVLMRPKPPKNGKRILLERITFIWKKFNFSHKVTARNIFRYKKRALMTIIGIAGCTGLMLTGFGIRDSVIDIPNVQFKQIFKYDLAVTLLNTSGLNDIEDYLQKNENINSYSKICAITGKLGKNGKEYNTTAFAVENAEKFNDVCNLVNYETDEHIDLNDDGIVITDKIADMLGVKCGDIITFTDGEEISYEFKIENITKNYVSHYVFMTKEFYEENIKSFKTNMLYVNTNDINEEMQNNISKDILEMNGVASVSIIETLMKSVQDMLKTMNYVVVILIVASALLDFVVLYNLANVNIAERQREIATLKVLGFYDREVDNYINKENIIFTFLGVGIGLIFGTFLTSGIISSIEIDSLRFMRNITIMSYVYSAIITITFSFAVNFIIHFVLKKIDMIESLKSVE